jgi:hypothetical protein
MNYQEFTKDELLFTYRKVKRELFYEKEYIRLDKILVFEENIDLNLDYLLSVLNSRNEVGLKDIINNIGDSTFIFKDISFKEKSISSVKKSIQNLKNNLFEIDKLDFRFMGDLLIFFQMIGGLWINRIGYKLDMKFPDNVYGWVDLPVLVDLPVFQTN